MGCALLPAILACGCPRLEKYGLSSDNDLIDAAKVDAIARETEVPDTAVLADTGQMAEASTDAGFDEGSDAKDTFEPDAPPPPLCDPTNLDLIACYRFEQAEHATRG